MGKFFKIVPKKGYPLAMPGLAEGLAKLERAWERIEIIGGHMEWSALGIPRLIIDENDANETVKRPFDISITGRVIKAFRCWYLRGTVWVMATNEPTITLSSTIPEGSYEIVSALIDTTTGAVTLTTGADTDGSTAESSVRIPIYTIIETASVLSVDVDLRGSAVVLYQ